MAKIRFPGLKRFRVRLGLDPDVVERLKVKINVGIDPAIVERLDENADEIAEVMSRMHEVARLEEVEPDHKAIEPWNVLGPLTLWEGLKIWRYLPDPLARRGRPRGRGVVANNNELIDALTSRVEAGERPTAAARDLLQERGVTGGLKNKADHLVRVWKANSVLK